MKKITLREAFLSLSIVLGLSIPASAQTQGKVLVFNTTDTKLSRVWNISDNGHFAVGSSLADGYTMYPFVWNLQNDSKFYLKDKNNATQECLNGDALDITNDGKIISGSYNNLPALYHSDTNTWTMLPIPEEYKANSVGTCSKMTPDGKSGIGMIYDNNTYFGTALYWKDGELVDVNLPEKNLFGGKVMISRFDDISADGEYLIGRLSYNEMPAASCAFIYKASSKEFKYIAEDFMKSVDISYRALFMLCICIIYSYNVLVGWRRLMFCFLSPTYSTQLLLNFCIYMLLRSVPIWYTNDHVHIWRGDS